MKGDKGDVGPSGPKGSDGAAGRGLTQTTADGLYLRKSAGTLTSALSMGTHKITDVADPTEDTDATNIAWVRMHTTGGCLSKGGGVVTGNLAMSEMRITNLGNPTDDLDATNKKWVESKIPKGLHHLMAYIKGSSDSHTVNRFTHNVLSVVYRKVGTNKQLVFNFRNDLSDGFYAYDFGIQKNGSDTAGLDIFLYRECGGSSFDSKVTCWFWAANKGTTL